MSNEETDVVARVFAQHIPEIAAGTVEIKRIARKPRFRSKLAVYSHDPNVDCIAACVGMQGSRIRPIVDALDNERIDLIRWNQSPEQLIRLSLQPAQIESISLDSTRQRATVYVEEDQLPLALGREGMNRDLASKLCGWDIEVVVHPSQPPSSDQSEN